jgi:hypothetical protein
VPAAPRSSRRFVSLHRIAGQNDEIDRFASYSGAK